MRIGIDATIYYTPEPAGLGMYTANVVNAIAKHHDDLVVWTVNDAHLRLKQDAVRLVMQALRWTGNNLFYVRHFWLHAILPKLIKQEGVDVVLTTVPSATPYSSVPHVVTVHDLIPLVCPREARLLVHLNCRYRMPLLLKKASSIICISEYTKRDLQKFFQISEDKLVTIYNGYDSARFFPQKTNPSILGRYGLTAKNYVLTVGCASSRKNLARILESFYLIHRNVPHDLVIVGSTEGHEMRRLQKKIELLNIRNRVSVLGYVPLEDLPQLYSCAALVIYVSLYEGFGLPIVEAMACGAPVLASKTTSIPEVGGEAAVYVDPLNVTAIATAAEQILNSAEQQRQMAIAGKANSSRFNWDKSAREIIDLLHHIR